MNAWSAEYGTFVLCIAFIVACIAVALLRYVDRWSEEQTQYIRTRKRR